MNCISLVGLGLSAAAACAPAAVPPPAPGPPAEASAAPPTSVLNDAFDVPACVVESGAFRYVGIRYNTQTGDSTYNGQPFSQAFPVTDEYAAAAPWFVNHEAVMWMGTRYIKYGLPRVLTDTDVVRVGEYRGVSLFVEPGVTGTPDLIYVSVRPACEFQRYETAVHGGAVRGG